MGLLFILLLASTNGVRAARKGYSIWLWTLVSAAAFLATFVAGIMIMLACLYKGNPMDRSAVLAFFGQGSLRSVTILMAGIGGLLAVRYAIDRLTPKNKDGADKGRVE